MANTYGVYNSGKIMLEYWCGDIHVDEMLEHQSVQHQDERIPFILSEIIDLRDAVIHLSDQDVVKVSDDIIKTQPLKKMAILINKCDWDKARLYSRSAWRLDVDVSHFIR